MALDKKSLNNFLPNGFETEGKEGYKTNFSDDKISTGFQKDTADILSGPNLNNLLDVVGKNTNILNDVNEFLNDMPIGSLPIVNSNNKLDYVDKNDLSQSGLPIGTIFPVTCTADYVPTGALPCDGTEYAKIQFNEFYTNYLVAGLLNTCTYTEYNADVTTYGSCAKFAIDTDNEKFKVPTIKNGAYITQALSDSELGKSYSESLPNITGWFTEGVGGSGTQVDGTLFKDEGNVGVATTSAIDYDGHKISFNLGRVNSTYQDNAKVQGDNVRMRYFVQVANGTINESQMDWSAWASSLQGKANVSLENLSTEGKVLASGWGMPSSKYIDLTLGSSGSTYTAPANGYFYAKVQATNERTTLSLQTNEIQVDGQASYYAYTGLFVPVVKGEVMTLYYSNVNQTAGFRFIYAKGEFV